MILEWFLPAKLTTRQQKLKDETRTVVSCGYRILKDLAIKQTVAIAANIMELKVNVLYSFAFKLKGNKIKSLIYRLNNQVYSHPELARQSRYSF